MAAGLLDDRQQFILDLDIAEEGLEGFVRLAARTGLAELDQPAIVAARSRLRPRQARARQEQLPLAANIGGVGLVGIGERLLPGQSEPRDAILIFRSRDRLPDVRLGRRPDFDAGANARRQLRLGSLAPTQRRCECDRGQNQGAKPHGITCLRYHN